MASTNARSARRRHRRLTCLLGAGLAALVPAAGATATVPIGDQVRVSVTGPDGDPTYTVADPVVAYNPRARQHLLVWQSRAGSADERILARLVDERGNPLGAEFPVSAPNRRAFEPAVVYNPRANEYLVAFERDTDTPGKSEIYIQRLSAAGAEIGDDIRVSRMGPDGVINFQARRPAIAYNEARNEYLVGWDGTSDTALTSGEREIYVQRLTADGAQVGTDDQRVSDMGTDGDATVGARDVDLAWNERRDEYMVVWEGDDDTAPHVNGEYEIFAQRLAGDGTELGPNDRRISDLGPPGDDLYDATNPSIAYNPATDEYMVVFEGERPLAGGGESEIFAQRLSYEGVEVGTDDQRISDMGPNGNPSYDAFFPHVAVNTRANEYLVTWRGDDDTAPLVNDKFEVFAQRLSATGAELDGNDVRVSFTQPEGDFRFNAREPRASYDSQLNQYLVVWAADSGVAPLVDGEFEVYARRFGAGTPVVVAGAQCKVLPALAEPRRGDPSKVTLTTTQLLINQRIDQAAIRRANGVQGWIDAGVQSRDLCQGMIDATKLSVGSVTGYTGVPLTMGPPDPRPVVVPAAQPGDPSKITLSVNQLLINQRISQAAIRRLNALKARLDAGLTGGDIVDGAVGRAQLVPGTRVLFSPVVSPPAAASTTNIAPPSPGDPSKVTLSTTQLLINQRISQAAVRRANELIHRLGQGIGAQEIRDGALTSVDLAPGLPASTTP